MEGLSVGLIIALGDKKKKKMQKYVEEAHPTCRPRQKKKM